MAETALQQPQITVVAPATSPDASTTQSTDTTGTVTTPTTLETTPVDTSARFRGGGTSFRAKLIGVDDVPDSRGDQMCQESILKLKAIVKASGQHKQKIVINITLDGLKIIDLMTANVIYQHAVDKISFIARDQTDRRAFGYVLGLGEGKHQFYGIKTAKIAEHTVLALRDLFQVVYDIKKKEIDEAKKNAEVSQTPEATYAVPNNKPPTNPPPAQEGSILALEEQLENMHQMSDMEAFKSNWSENMPTSPDTPATPGGNFNMFGEAPANAATDQQASYADDLAGFDMEALEPAAGGGAKLTKDQILAGFGSGGQQQQQSPFFGTQQQQPGFGGPQQPAPFGAPQPSAAFGAPQRPGFGAPQQPGFGGAPAPNPFGGGQQMGMFTPGPRPVVPARTGAMRPPTATPAQSGAPQNPFGDAFGDTSSGPSSVLAPIDSQPKLANGSQEDSKPKDPFASLIPGMGDSSSTKKDMFKNFQMAKPQAGAPKPAENDGAGLSSNFDDYFMKSVGGVPLDVSTQQAPAAAPAAVDPFAALGGSGFDQSFGTNAQQSGGNTQQSLFG